MKKYNINGHEMLMLDDVKCAIRRLRRRYDKSDLISPEEKAVLYDTLDDVVKEIFAEELSEARRDYDGKVNKILEMSGDFAVYKRGECKRDISYVIALGAWGKPVIGENADLALHFTYESEAKKVAKDLGEGWEVIDLTPGAYADEERLLKAIFGEEESYAEH